MSADNLMVQPGMVQPSSALSFTCLVEDRFALAESPVWDGDNNCLLWVDIPAATIHELALATGMRRRWQLDGTIGSIGLARSGRLVVARRNQVGLLDRDSGTYEMLAELFAASPEFRLNDGKVGPDGAFWVGSMDESGQYRPLASLYRVTADGGVSARVEGVITSNGLAWSADGTRMFHSDSRGCWIDRWDFNPASGALGARRRIATPATPDGRPDGGASDIAGGYWSCGVSAGCLNRYDADGSLLAKYAVPVAAPTMPCFGGEDMRTLFITSLRQGLSELQLAAGKLAGAVLVARADVAGTPIAKFSD